MNDKSIKIMQSWIDGALEELDEQEIQEYCYGIIMYGLYGQEVELKNKAVKIALKLIYPQMTKMEDAYQKKIDGGLNSKKAFKVEPELVWQLAQTEKTVPKIIERLAEMGYGDVNPKTLYSNKGWLNRDNKDFAKMPVVEGEEAGINTSANQASPHFNF